MKKIENPTTCGCLQKNTFRMYTQSTSRNVSRPSATWAVRTLPRTTSMANANGVFVVSLTQLRSHVGVSAGDSAENAQAALIALQAGFCEVTIQDPERSNTVVSWTGSIKVIRVGTGQHGLQVVIPVGYLGGMTIPAWTHTASVSCSICGSTGHMATQHQCRQCSGFGHRSSACPSHHIGGGHHHPHGGGGRGHHHPHGGGGGGLRHSHGGGGHHHPHGGGGGGLHHPHGGGLHHPHGGGGRVHHHISGGTATLQDGKLASFGDAMPFRCCGLTWSDM
jgi:hypothetical protein